MQFFSTPLSILLCAATIFVHTTPVHAQTTRDRAQQRREARLQRINPVTMRTKTPVSSSAPALDRLFTEEEQRIAAVEKADPAVVSVIISKQAAVIRDGSFVDSGILDIGGGTAFFVSEDGLLMTNNHVVEDPNAQYAIVLNTGEDRKSVV